MPPTRLVLLNGRLVIIYGDGAEIRVRTGGRVKSRKCEGKDKLTERAALGRVRSLEAKNGVPYDAYTCDDHWHIGHSHKFFTLEEKRYEKRNRQVES